MSEYSSFAFYYDGLTRDVSYSKYADFIENVFERFGHAPGIILDAACGTGSLTLELFKRGYDIYGADMSTQMLSVAEEKALEAGARILFLCQKLQNLDLYGTVDTVLCSLDSVNHLENENEVLKAFSKISFFMNPGGYFIFDVNTEYKHREVLADNVFVYDTEAVYCIWQNETSTSLKTEISLDFFERRGELYKRSSEHFCERAYSAGTLCGILGKAGFSEICVFDGLSFEPPRENSQRLSFVAKKI